MSKPASSGAKILRVGVIRDGKIIEERQIRHPAAVTVGQDGTNTFVIPASELPATFPVFEQKAGKYTLLFTDRMNGRVKNNKSGDLDFAALKSKGLVQRRGNVWALPLDESARGKVSLGEVTLLFQFVSPPPEPARLELPAEVRGTVWRSIDHLFFGILAASLFLHFAGAACIMLSPKPPDPDLALDDLPDRFARVLLPPKPPEPEQSKAPEQTAQVEEKKDVKKDVKKKDLPDDAIARKAVIQQKVAGKGLLKILGSAGGSGALSDVLGSGTGSGDVAAALAGARGVSIATADSVGARAGDGAGRTAGIGDVGTAGGGKVALASKGDAKVTGRVSAAAPEVDSADVDRAALSRYIRDRLGAIRGCYERELKRNPSLKGKVVVRFNITPAGRAGDIRIEENTLGSAEVAGCVQNLMRSWIFPFKPPDEVPVQYPFLFTSAG